MNFNDTDARIPFYIRASVLLVGLIALFYAIYAAQTVILPFVFSLLVAILLNPLVTLLTKKGVNRIFAILLVLACTIILMAGIVFFIASEFYSFSEELPLLREKLTIYTDQGVDWMAEKFRLSDVRIKEWISKRKSDGLGNGNLIGNAAITVSHFFTLLLLVPVYIFLILYYKMLLLTFISRLFPRELHATVVVVLSEVRVLVQHYLVGLLIEMGIVSGLTSIGLTIVGVRPAILFGIITGFLNTIPYVGVLISNITFTLIALLTKSPTTATIVFCIYVVVQFIDNNIVVPRIVGAKVQINALATILIVLVGGELCGVAGMVLGIPVLGILKVIFDHIKPLEPLGFLLGDSFPKSEKNIFRTGSGK
jgi:predicted PurR-regulated permease PerM